LNETVVAATSFLQLYINIVTLNSSPRTVFRQFVGQFVPHNNTLYDMIRDNYCCSSDSYVDWLVALVSQHLYRIAVLRQMCHVIIISVLCI